MGGIARGCRSRTAAPLPGRCYLAGMSTTRILALGAAALLLYLAFSYGLRTAFPRTEVGYATALTGRVTGAMRSKDQRSFFLDGRAAPRYDFDAFAPVPSAGQAPADGTRLGQYLRTGDLVRKPGRATGLTVQRGDSLTHWMCTPPQAIP